MKQHEWKITIDYLPNNISNISMCLPVPSNMAIGNHKWWFSWNNHLQGGAISWLIKPMKTSTLYLP